jgi:hypothetical protein
MLNGRFITVVRHLVMDPAVLLLLLAADSSSSESDGDLDVVVPVVAALAVLSTYLFAEKRALMTRLVNPGFDLNGGWNDADFLFHFRFTEAQIKQMVFLFDLPARLPLRYNISGYKAMCILLHRFAYPSRLAAEAHFWGKGHNISQISSVITYLVKYIFSRYSKLLFFDGEGISKRIASYVAAIARCGCPIAGIWGFVDGTCRGCCRPSRLQRLIYSGYKRRHVFKFQGVVTPDGLFSAFFGPIEGRHSDAYMMEKSMIYEAMEMFEEIFRDMKLWGDGGYGISKYILRPFIAPVAGSIHQAFNTRLSTLRISAEWGFNWVITNFKYLDYEEQQKCLLMPTSLFYCVAVLLANCKTCMMGGNQISSYFDLAPPTLQEYLRDNTKPFLVTPPCYY